MSNVIDFQEYKKRKQDEENRILVDVVFSFDFGPQETDWAFSFKTTEENDNEH